jgi:hypothetical protein
LKSGEFRSFFPWKILCIGHNHIFQVEIWQDFAQKEFADGELKKIKVKLE